MQIKAADDRQHDLDILAGLLDRPDVDGPRRHDIEREIATMKAGIAAERAAAYEIELYFGKSANFLTIHDLRIEVDEFAAQIDHLILNRLGEIWVCESKHFAEGVSVNDQGEWLRWWGGRAQGIPSPVEQNRRHMHLLGRVFDEGRVPLPRRLGLAPMRPDLRSLVLVSNNARIGRPRRRLAELEDVIKVEKIESRVRGAIDQSAAHRFGRMMGKEGLEAFARDLAALHRPIQFDWVHRFGLKLLADVPHLEDVSQQQPVARSEPGPLPSRGSGHRCAQCGQPVSFAVVKFCWINSKRFGGSIYCMVCQKVVKPA